MRIIDCIQGEPEWFKARKGIPTGSEFGRIMTAAKGDYAAGATTYADELVSEAAEWVPSFTGTPDTERGTYMENEARRWLSFNEGIELREVGFCLSDCGRYGASPDALMEDGSPVEIKCPQLPKILGYWREFEKTGEVPRVHKVQCHAEMLAVGADKCLFLGYADSQYIENLTITVHRDEFTEKLEACADRFCDELEELQRKRFGDEYGPMVETLHEWRHENSTSVF